MNHRKRVFAIATLALATLAVGGIILSLTLARRGQGRADVPPDSSESLRGVAEPVTMIYAISWDDGGSQGLIFRDSKGRKFSVCLQNTLDDDRSLCFGSIYPQEGRAVPIGGVEERALLGLLERWATKDPDARTWDLKLKQRQKTNGQSPYLTGDETEQQRGNAFAVLIKNKLNRRN